MNYKEKYHNKSIRAKWWNYKWSASYFVTINTLSRAHFFGYVKDDKMILSDIGKIVKEEWLNTYQMRPDMNLTMGAYIIMPNHFHCIISIGKNSFNEHQFSSIKTIPSDVTMNCHNKFGPQSKNLASIIRGFKIGVTRNARKVNPDFAWQSRYHDHIIRNQHSYEKIADYIQNNPSNWKEDDLYSFTI